MFNSKKLKQLHSRLIDLECIIQNMTIHSDMNLWLGRRPKYVAGQKVKVFWNCKHKPIWLKPGINIAKVVGIDIRYDFQDEQYTYGYYVIMNEDEYWANADDIRKTPIFFLERELLEYENFASKL